MSAFCPECPHCRPTKLTTEERITVVSTLAKMRPWEFAHYGEKITSIVDWYDGWWVGLHAEEKDADVPPQIIDKRQWVSGFAGGWKDAEQARNWRLTYETALA